MCGIAGFVLTKNQDDCGNTLREMTRAVKHRGPDDEGFFEAYARNGSSQVGMGHRRLAIIDLSSGHQPMSNEDGSVQIVFNGEIYNFQELRSELIARGHRFKTASDTETIVHAYEEYGEDCVDKFRGMFAFALWDANQEKLFLARDHFGKKPLFLHLMPKGLLFASEIKSILAFPNIEARLDHMAVWDYLLYRYVPGPRTLFQHIDKLPPGSVAVWQNGKLNVRRFYAPPDRNVLKAPYVGGDPIVAFGSQLDESVRIRMVSDVPFGAFLSGGIDSSAVVGFMARHSTIPVSTFSVGFQESEYSELAYAREVANWFRTKHHELIVSASELMGYLPELVRARDAPVSEPSDIPIYLLSREARRSVKMVLTGEGSDELLGGYPKHVVERYAQFYQGLPSFVRRGLIEPLVFALPYRFRRVKTATRALSVSDAEERFACWFGGLSPRGRAELAKFASAKDTRPRKVAPFDVETGNSFLRRILYFDQTSWLPDNLLERGDRMTMAASLEARMPFMDKELAAFVSSLPDWYRVRGIQTKWILRQAMKALLPERILRRPKVGFRVPVNEWFRGRMRDYLMNHLLGPGSRTKDLYQERQLGQILNEHLTGRQNHEKLLWSLLTLEIWAREYSIAL